MLVFVDESGDPGFKLNKGSTPFFTVALVMFEGNAAALSCQAALMQLKSRLGMPQRQEFKFYKDGHNRRLAVLRELAMQELEIYSFTLDKTSERLADMPELHNKALLFRWMIKMALDGIEDHLLDADIIIDGAGERLFRQQIMTYLRQQINSPKMRRIHGVKISDSQSDVLLQAADYAAGVTNRLYAGGEGAAEYNSYLLSKRRSLRKWP